MKRTLIALLLAGLTVSGSASAQAGLLDTWNGADAVVEGAVNASSVSGTTETAVLTVTAVLAGSAPETVAVSHDTRLACAGVELSEGMTGLFFVKGLNGSPFVSAFYSNGLAVEGAALRQYAADLAAALQEGSEAAAAVCTQAALNGGVNVSALALEDRLSLAVTVAFSNEEVSAFTELYGNTASSYMQKKLREVFWLSGNAEPINALVTGLAVENSKDTARVLAKIEKDTLSLDATTALSQALGNAGTEAETGLCLDTLASLGTPEAAAVIAGELTGDNCALAAKALASLANDQVKTGSEVAFEALRNNLDKGAVRVEYDAVSKQKAK